MNLNAHYALSKSLAGTHSFLSPSNPSWLNYEDDKLDRVYHSAMTARRGTDLHNLAKDLIRLGVKLPDVPKTLNLYVNDAIGFRMTPEVLLYYSDNCYGHADAVCFRNNILRVHDLKNGVNTSSMAQPEIYAALFCLEYKFDPFQIGFELRIYQSNVVKVHQPDAPSIMSIMEKIKYFDKRIEELKKGD